MKIIGVIPSRYGAQRLPGKPLLPIAGKPLLQWVIEGARKSQKLSQLLVATDHEEIMNLCKKLGVEAVMTPSELPSGSDRVWVAVKDLEFDVVVNIQGDEPLVNGEVIDRLVEPFLKSKGLEMATLAKKMTAEALNLRTTAKIVVNQSGEALYFSRFPIPYSRDDAGQDFSGSLQHIGLYAYSKEFLAKYCDQAPAIIEKFEGLEQLRALYMGAKIQVVEVEHQSWGVDTPEDLERIEKLLKS